MKISKKYEWVMEGLNGVPLLVKTQAMKHFMMPSKEYLPKKKVKGEIDSLVKCALCPNMCRFDCPVSESSKNRSLSPSGKSGIVFLLLTERINGADALDIAYQCCGCGSCQLWCPFGFSLGDVLRSLHEDMVDMELVPESVKGKRAELVEKHRFEERTVEVCAPEKGEVLLFLGCTASAHHPGIAESLLKICTHVGESFALIPDEWCCGAPLYTFGYVEDCKDFAEENIRRIQESGCKKLVCVCPSCTKMFREIYPELGAECGVEILHVSEYLKGLLDAGKLQCSKEISESMVYHDPCKLSRGLEIVDEPREVLAAIPGLEVKEPQFYGKESHCCGRGSGLGRTYPDLAGKATALRLKELGEQADAIVTACPTCKKAFLDENVECMDICEVVARSLEKT